MTVALEGGEWSAARPGRILHPGKTRYPLYRRPGGSQDRSGRAENLVPTGIRSRTVQSAVSRKTDWATRPTTKLSTHETLSTQIPSYTVFRFPATRDKPPQTAVNNGDISGVDCSRSLREDRPLCPNTLRQCLKNMMTKISLHFKHIHFVRHREHCDWITKTNQLMPHSKSIAVYSKTYMKRMKYTVWAKYSVYLC